MSKSGKRPWEFDADEEEEAGSMAAEEPMPEPPLERPMRRVELLPHKRPLGSIARVPKPSRKKDTPSSIERVEEKEPPKAHNDSDPFNLAFLSQLKRESEALRAGKGDDDGSSSSSRRRRETRRRAGSSGLRREPPPELLRSNSVGSGRDRERSKRRRDDKQRGGSAGRDELQQRRRGASMGREEAEQGRGGSSSEEEGRDELRGLLQSGQVTKRQEILPVEALTFTQDSVRGNFSCGRSLEHTKCLIINKQLDPRDLDWMILEVSKVGNTYRSSSNRRLKVLKDVERETRRKLFVRCEVTTPVDKNLARMLDRLTSTSQLAPKDIRIRRPGESRFGTKKTKRKPKPWPDVRRAAPESSRPRPWHHR
eukprot:TRINITY_DN64772_c0_g1_i1.p1 TRINITY_DN64772_c0_g1~~TRINITY_DN64772_c0_g1_i1.p1  ORF type:complete len:367 (-),score=85.52 TRINITY_DN64772_c0_g1_i1:466-1566(-)